MWTSKFVSGKDSKVNNFTSDDLFSLWNEEEGVWETCSAKRKKIGGHVENSRNEIKVISYIEIMVIVKMTNIKRPIHANKCN